MRIRKKGKWKTGENKFVIEENGKYVETLPPINELLKLLCPEIASCSDKEEKIETEEIIPRSSLNQRLNEQIKQDEKQGDGTLISSIVEEGQGAYEGIVWICNKCDFKTPLYFKDKSCPYCKKRVQEELNKLGVV